MKLTQTTDAVAPVGANRTAVLILILVSYVMIILDTSVVLTGLPQIHRELGFGDAGLSWVQSAYTLTFGGFLLLGARAGDIFGRRRMFLLGLTIFTLASLAIGAAPSPEFLLAARAVQGIGAAVLAPATLALLQTHFPSGPERVRAVSYYAAVAGIAASAGLALGGILADWISWRVGFYVNLPIGLAMLLATRRYVVETERSSGRLDLIGAVTSTVGMSVLVYGLVRSASAGWRDAVTLAALVVAVCVLALFVFSQTQVKAPLLPLRLFTSRERVGAYAARMLFLGAMVGFFFFVTQFLQTVAGYDAFMSGLAFLPMTLVNFFVAMTVPQLTKRVGNARVLTAGLALAAVGMAWLSQLSAGGSYWLTIALPMVLIGAGQGLAFSPLTASGIAGVAPEDAGAASGAVNVAHQLGNSLGLGVLVAVSAFGGDGLTGTGLMAHRVAAALTAGTVFLIFALLLAVALILRPRRVVAAPLPLSQEA